MPVEQADGADRRAVTHLEAFSRLIAGLSPWLELSSVSGAERQAQARMFSAMVEAGLKLLGAPWDRLRVDYALRQHEQWYKGDGIYGDGPSFHAIAN